MVVVAALARLATGIGRGVVSDDTARLALVIAVSLSVVALAARAWDALGDVRGDPLLLQAREALMLGLAAIAWGLWGLFRSSGRFASFLVILAGLMFVFVARSVFRKERSARDEEDTASPCL